MTAPTPPAPPPATETERVQQGMIARLLQRNADLTAQVVEVDTRYDLLHAEHVELKATVDELVQLQRDAAAGRAA